MAIVGSAHVIIRAITEKLESDIKNALNKIKPAANKSGGDAGAEWSKSFGIAANFNGSKVFEELKAAASRAGNDHGGRYGHGFLGSIARSLASGRRTLVNYGSGIGSAFGIALRDGFASSGASGTILSIGLRIAALIPILGAIIGAISNLVSGLYAVAAAGGVAVNSLIVFGSVIGAVVQGIGTAVIAFGGVGKAISAGMKAATVSSDKAGRAAKDAARKAVDAARAVADAERNLKDAREQASRGIEDAKRRVQDAQRAVKDAHENTARAIQDAARNVRDATRAASEAQEAAAENIKNALERVRDARQGVTDAYHDAARREKDAIDDVRRAEDNLASAHKRVQDAQEALTRARKDARESLIDLKFSIEENAIAERRAQLALSDAKFELEATKGLPATNRARIEAELAYREADLNLRQIRERQDDLAQEKKQIDKTGIEGTDAVKNAKDNLKDAEQGVRDAVQGVSDALERQTEVQRENTRAIQDSKDALVDAKKALDDAYRDGPRRIADANRALADAKRAYKDAYEDAPRQIGDANRALADAKRALRDAYENAPRLIGDAKRALADAKREQRDANRVMRAGSNEAIAFQNSLKGMSLPARRFVKYIISIREELLSLRKAAQRGLFPPLIEAIQTLVDGLFPSLRRALFRTGQAVGNAAKTIADAMTSGPFIASFRVVTEQNAVTIERLGIVMGDLTRIVFALLDAAEPIIDMFTNWMVSWTRARRVSVEARNESGELTKSFQRSARVAKLLIRITKNLFEGFYDVGKIAVPQGLRLLRVFEKVTERFANFTDKAKNRKFLRKFFKDTADNFIAISSLVKELGAAFLRLGADPALGKVAKALEKTVAALETVITRMLDRSGTQIADFINVILDTFSALADSGAFNIFLETMTGFLRIILKLVKTPVIGDLIKGMLGIGAAMYALNVVRKFPGISNLDGMIRSLGRQAILFKTKSKNMEEAMFKIRSASTKTAKSLGKGLARGIGTAARATKNFISINGSKMIGALKKLAINVRLVAGAFAWKVKQMIISMAVAARQKAAMIGQALATKAVAAATTAWAFAQRILNAAMSANPLGLAIAAIVAIGAALVLAYKKFEGFRKVVDTVFSFIVDAAKWVWDVLFGHSIFPDMLKAFKKIFTAIGKVIKFWWDNVVKPVWDALIKFAEKVLVPVIKFFWKVIKVVFKAIGLFIKMWWNYYVKPIFKIFTWFINKVLIPVIKFFWTKVIKPIFGLIGKFIQFWWNRIVKPIFQAFNKFIKTVVVPIIKWFWKNVIKPVFTWIGDKIKNVWRNVIKPVFQALRDFVVDRLVPAFRRGIGAIGRIWDSLRRLAAKPVNFIIDTVYNKGIRRLVNKVLGWFGVDRQLPKIAKVTWGNNGGSNTNAFGGSGGVSKTAGGRFATGGIAPGYTPGRDIHHVMVSGGEAIMRPEWTRAVGEDTVNQMNRVARTGGIRGVRKALGYALGGVIPAVGTWSRHTSGYDWARWAGDINVPGPGDFGNPVRAYKDGVVAAVKYLGDRSYGRYIKINHPKSDEQTLYAHLSKALVEVGQHVSRGQLIGRVGDIGNASGPHLHFEIKGGTGPIEGGGGGGVLGWLKRKVAGGVGKLGGFVNNALDHLPGGDSGWGRMLKAIPRKFVSTATDYIQELLTREEADAVASKVGGVDGPTPGSVQRYAGVVRKALNMLHQPLSLVDDVLRRMMKESGGNPGIVNTWDSNWQRGTPSVGLMQVIGPTFRAYAGKFKHTGPFKYGTSVDPLANVYAGLNYALHRYGSIGLAMNKSGGYALGGVVPEVFDSGGIASGADAWMPKRTARPERVLSPQQTEAFDRLVAILDRGSVNGGSGGDTINLDVHVPQDASARDVVDGIVYELRRSRNSRGGKYR